MKPTIALIGSGNVATNLGLALQKHGYAVTVVYSKSLAHAQTLAKQLKATATDILSAIPTNLDLYILAVKDDVLGNVSSQLKVKGLVIHTSGSVPLQILSAHKHRGVFYPLQTLTKKTPIAFKAVPILLEASTTKDLQLLHEIASELSNDVLEVSSTQRQMLHVAAVFANNFTNHLMGVAKDLLAQYQLPEHLLDELIQRTAKQAITHHPFSVQTGPVARNDMETVSMHIQLLQQNPQYRQVYEMLSQSIARSLQEKKV